MNFPRESPQQQTATAEVLKVYQPLEPSMTKCPIPAQSTLTPRNINPFCFGARAKNYFGCKPWLFAEVHQFAGNA